MSRPSPVSIWWPPLARRPNGASKTTFVKAVATLLRPSGGTLQVSGIDVAAQPGVVRRIIGLAGQTAAVEPALTGRENLVMIARLFGHDTRAARAAAAVVLDEINMVDDGSYAENGRITSGGSCPMPAGHKFPRERDRWTHDDGERVDYGKGKITKRTATVTGRSVKAYAEANAPTEPCERCASETPVTKIRVFGTHRFRDNCFAEFLAEK